MEKILFLFAIAFTTTLSAQTTITVELQGLASDKGNAFIAIYDTESAWLNEAYKGSIKSIKDGKSVAVFENIPDGTYAVSCFHDENDNKELDTNFIGIPKEAYACSNDAKAMFSAPKWEDAKFETNGEELTIPINF